MPVQFGLTKQPLAVRANDIGAASGY